MRSANEIAAELIASGLAPGQTALLMELVLSMSTGLSTGQGGENRALEKRRAWDRDRKKRLRDEKRQSAFSTGLPPDSTGLPVENADVVHVEEEKNRSFQGEERKKTRGSRLLSGARVSDENRAVAIECGCPPDRVEALWTEFVDYWSEIPGQRGCKISWNGTWRNRVKSVFGTGIGNIGRTHGKAQGDNPRSGSLIGAIDRRLAQIEGESDPALPADNILRISHRSV